VKLGLVITINDRFGLGLGNVFNNCMATVAGGLVSELAEVAGMGVSIPCLHNDYSRMSMWLLL